MELNKQEYDSYVKKITPVHSLGGSMAKAFLTGGLIMQVRISLLDLVIGTAVSVLIALLVEFFVFSVDYSRTEYAQFEDDEYYYYVKAVPKMSIAIPDKKVKKINTRRRNTRRKH